MSCDCHVLLLAAVVMCWVHQVKRVLCTYSECVHMHGHTCKYRSMIRSSKVLVEVTSWGKPAAFSRPSLILRAIEVSLLVSFHVCFAFCSCLPAQLDLSISGDYQ